MLTRITGCTGSGKSTSVLPFYLEEWARENPGGGVHIFQRGQCDWDESVQLEALGISRSARPVSIVRVLQPALDVFVERCVEALSEAGSLVVIDDFHPEDRSERPAKGLIPFEALSRAKADVLWAHQQNPSTPQLAADWRNLWDRWVLLEPANGEAAHWEVANLEYQKLGREPSGGWSRFRGKLQSAVRAFLGRQRSQPSSVTAETLRELLKFEGFECRAMRDRAGRGVGNEVVVQRRIFPLPRQMAAAACRASLS